MSIAPRISRRSPTQVLPWLNVAYLQGSELVFSTWYGRRQNLIKKINSSTRIITIKIREKDGTGFISICKHYSRSQDTGLMQRSIYYIKYDHSKIDLVINTKNEERSHSILALLDGWHGGYLTMACCLLSSWSTSCGWPGVDWLRGG